MNKDWYTISFGHAPVVVVVAAVVVAAATVVVVVAAATVVVVVAAVVAAPDTFSVGHVVGMHWFSPNARIVPFKTHG